MSVKVTRWSGPGQPSEAAIHDLLKQEGLSAYRWSNGPRDVYGAHAHHYNKVIYVVRGSIVFGLPGSGEEVTLQEGDRLDLPARVTHDAVVGPQGVVCLEAHR
jgi:quercetin dioxygenase-like cupin family protein